MKLKEEFLEEKVQFVYSVLVEDYLYGENYNEHRKDFDDSEFDVWYEDLAKLITRFGFRHMIYAAGIAQRQYDIKERFKKIGGIAYNDRNKIDWVEKERMDGGDKNGKK